jgi:hypothetical protein
MPAGSPSQRELARKVLRRLLHTDEQRAAYAKVLEE